MLSLKTRLIQQLRDPEVSLRAVAALREHGWLSDTTLRNADLRGAWLKGADLRNIDLSYANLEHANLCEANLSGANLTGAFLAGANLTSAILRKANLTDTALIGANLERADFKGARTEQTRFDGANLRHAQIDELQLLRADMLRHAMLPDGTTYDGRFSLPTDLAQASANGFDAKNPSQLAEWYRVSTERYQRGQDWEWEHLLPLHRELAELRLQEEAAKLTATNRVLPSPAAHIVTLSAKRPADYWYVLHAALFDPVRLSPYKSRGAPAARESIMNVRRWLVATLLWLPVWLIVSHAMQPHWDLLEIWLVMGTGFAWLMTSRIGRAHPSLRQFESDFGVMGAVVIGFLVLIPLWMGISLAGMRFMQAAFVITTLFSYYLAEINNKFQRNGLSLLVGLMIASVFVSIPMQGFDQHAIVFVMGGLFSGLLLWGFSWLIKSGIKLSPIVRGIALGLVGAGYLTLAFLPTIYALIR